MRNRYLAGDVAGAEEASRSAKKWSITSLLSGMILEVAIIIFIIVYYIVFASWCGVIP